MGELDRVYHKLSNIIREADNKSKNEVISEVYQVKKEVQHELLEQQLQEPDDENLEVPFI